MKIPALILLLPLAVFLVETTSFVPVMQDSCIKAAPENKSVIKRTKQCHKPEKPSCSKMKMQRSCCAKKGENKKPSGKGCENNPDCTTCPVCYTFIFQPQYEWPAQQLLFKKSYSVLTADNISSFTPDVWKPPNGTSLNS